MGSRRLIRRPFALLGGLAALVPMSASAQQVGPAPGGTPPGPELVASAEIPGGVIEGEVLEAGTGKPLAGAVVSIPGTDVGVVSDDRGRFRVEAPTKTTLVLRVRTLGYVRQDWQLDISEDEGLRLRLLLVQAPVYSSCNLRIGPVRLEEDARSGTRSPPRGPSSFSLSRF